MPVFVLTVLKVVFLALLYFFVYRAVRSVIVDLRGAREPAGQPERGMVAKAIRPARQNGAKPPRMVVVTDDRGGRMEPLKLDGTTPLEIGRAEACQVRLSDSYVSSFHARIFNRDGSWYIEDLGSTNGTYLNQRKLTSPAELQAGDHVRLGKTTLELRR